MILYLANGFSKFRQIGNRTVQAFLCFAGITFPVYGQTSYAFECEANLCEEVSFLNGEPILNYEEDNHIFQRGSVLEYTVVDQISGLPHDENKSVTGSVTITVNPEISNMMREMVGAYHQTGVEFSYSSNLGISTAKTGVIENVRNVWIHPFRGGQLAKINLNAYPFVKFPLCIGEKYEWELSVGGPKYSDLRWKTWTGTTVRKHQYEVVAKEKVFTPLSGKAIEVFVIQAQTNGEIGQSSAKFWYSEYFGFIYIKYYNIDGTITEFRLLKVEKR